MPKRVGLRPRLHRANWFLIAAAGRDQSIAPSVFFSRGAFVTSEASCGTARNVAGFQPVDRFAREPGTDVGEANFELRRRFVGADGDSALRDDTGRRRFAA